MVQYRKEPKIYFKHLTHGILSLLCNVPNRPLLSDRNLTWIYCMSDQKCHTLSASFIVMHLASAAGCLPVCHNCVLCMPQSFHVCACLHQPGDGADIPT